MKKFQTYIIVGLILIALIIIKVQFFASPKAKNKEVGKDKKSPIVPVSVYVVENKKLNDRIHASGTILANEAAELRVESSGRVNYIYLPEGKMVQAGTLLLKLNEAEYLAQMSKNSAQLKLLSDNEMRQKKLFEKQAISQQEYDISVANLYSLKADSVYLRTQILKSEIKAPFTGVIGIKNISKGSYITPNDIITEIHQIDPVKVEFSLPEKYSYFFKVGDKIKFKTEGIADTFQAKISVKDPSVNLNNRSIRYHAICSNPKGKLLPGVFAEVELTLEENNQTYFVPTEAVVPVAKGKKIFVVKEGIAEDRLVETGIRTEDFIQIVSGIVPGDSVVVNGNFQLKKGSAVKVKGPAKDVKKANL